MSSLQSAVAGGIKEHRQSAVAGRAGWLATVCNCRPPSAPADCRLHLPTVRVSGVL